MFMPGAYTGQKAAWDPLELELQAVVSHHVDNGNQTPLSNLSSTSLDLK